MRDGGVSISQDISIVQKFQSISIHILEINDVYTYVQFFIIIIKNYVYVSEYGYWHWLIWFLF